VEPTAAITDTYLRVLHYANPQYPVICEDTSLQDPYPYPFVGARLRLYVEPAEKPSVHFNATLRVEKAVFGPQGGLRDWEKQWSNTWVHSNVPPHAITPPGDTPTAGMWLHTGDHTNTWYREPGVYRVQGSVQTDTGDSYLKECYVSVPEGAAP
jgi:hypothetical protein